MLVENKFVFVKIPKNASTSVQNSFFLHDIHVNQDEEINIINQLSIEKIKNGQFFDIPNYHQHISVLYSKFPKEKYKYVGIKRDSTDRFISAYKHILYKIKYGNYNAKVDFLKFNENDLIEYLTPVLQKIGTIVGINENHYQIVKDFFCDNDDEIENSSWLMLVKNFQSQYFWGINEMDYVFDFNNLKNFEKFISNELNIDFHLLHENSTDKVTSRIKKTDKLDEFVYKLIDSPFLEKKLI